MCFHIYFDGSGWRWELRDGPKPIAQGQQLFESPEHVAHMLHKLLLEIGDVPIRINDQNEVP
jgi:intein/homing endonuclease